MSENKSMYLTEEKLAARMRELEAYRFVSMESVAPLTAMEGSLPSSEVYSRLPEKIEGREMKIGEDFVGRDRYLYLSKTVTLPAHRDGMEVYGLFDFGRIGFSGYSDFESLLFVDGREYQGVDTLHQDVNLEPLAGKTVTLTFLLWTGLCGKGPEFEIRQRLKRADVGYLHSDTDEFYYLAKAIVKTIALMDPDRAERYALIRSLDRAFDGIDWDRNAFYDTVTPALSRLKEELSHAKKENPVTVNLIGHTHIDVAYLWRIKHTREKAQRSFSTVTRLMEEFPEYLFLQSQPQLYEFLKQDAPRLYEKIKVRAKEGRWEADGGMWLEADCNLPGGESLTRQFLYGIRFFEKEFGHRSEYLWLPDVFGYSWALPQILLGVGIKSFMTTKISWNQFNTMPHDLFCWRGMDGSEVMTYFITTPDPGKGISSRFSTYNGLLSPRTVIGSRKKFRDKELSDETLLAYGFGDGGGGPNRNMLKMRRAMEQVPGLPNVKPSRAGDFFRRMRENLKKADRPVPTWDGELYLEYHRGTYTSQAYNKRMNRKMEFALAECEWLSALAALSGAEYPREELDGAWKVLLRNQFHDIIPGSSIHEVYEDARAEYEALTRCVEELTARALSRLTRPEEDAWTLRHSGSFPRRSPVFIPEARQGRFVSENGEPLPAQRADGGYYVEASLPALALSGVRFQAGEEESAASPFVADMAQGRLLTPHYEIEWDGNGQITRFFDRDNGREVLKPGEKANQLRVYEDRPLNYENWDVDIFHLLKSDEAVLSEPPVLVESGPLLTRIRFRYRYRASEILQDMVVYAASRRIDFETQVDWHESRRLLKAVFPVDVRSTKATYDIQYGHVERPTHFNTSWDYARFEVVAHKWADLSEEDYGVSILNDCKYGHSVHGNVMSITLLKSGKSPDPEADMGEHAFTYSFLPHAGSVTRGDTIEESVSLNLPVRAEKGRLPVADSFLSACRNVAVDACKMAEDGNGLILRIHECRGGRASACIRPGFPVASYQKTNLLEEEAGDAVSAPVIETRLRPFEIQTFRIRQKGGV